MAKRKKAAGRRRARAADRFGDFAIDDAVEAQAMLGDLADTPAESEARYREGIAIAERDRGADWFERQAGRLGRMPEARAYLQCRRGLVQCLVATGRHEEALAECERLARLDTDDTISARFMHLDILITLRRFAAARALCSRYAHEPYSGWPYFRALIAFADGGDSAEARRLLSEAIEANPHVPRLLLAGEQIEGEFSIVTVGEEDEAAVYAGNARATWLDVPGAMSWLRGCVDAAHAPPDRPRRPPSGARLDALAALPQDGAEEWQIDLSRGPGREWSLHVVSGDDGRMIKVEVSTTKPRGEEMWNVLDQAMRFPHDGEPRRPAVVAMRPGVFPASWGKRFLRLGIRQEVRDVLPELDRAMADVDDRIALAERARAEEADAGFDPAAVAAALAGLPQVPGEIWEADVSPAPAWVTGEGEPYRPWLTLVVSRTQNQVIVPDMSMARPDDGHLLRVVLRAVREAGIRPERLDVADAGVAARLGGPLGRAAIGVAASADGLAMIETVAESLAVAIAGPDTLRPLARVPGMTDDVQRALYAAAADFYRARPWRKLPSDTPLDIRGPGDRLVHAVVMGQSGIQQGLAVYEDRTTLAAAMRGDEKAAARSTSLAVMYGEAFEIAARDHDAIQQRGFEVAGPEAWPLVIRMEPGFAARPPLVWEAELITACLRDVVKRVAAGGDRP